MPSSRITSSTEYLRYTFTEQERLAMGSELAEAHNKLDDIDAEESVIKAQIKERRAGLEQKVGTLSRELATGFTMRDIKCSLAYDKPNVGEVEYWRDDLGTLVKTRPMTQSERQIQIDFDKPIAARIDASIAALDQFFAPPPQEAQPDPIAPAVLTNVDHLIEEPEAAAIVEQVAEEQPKPKRSHKKKPVIDDDIPF